MKQSIICAKNGEFLWDDRTSYSPSGSSGLMHVVHPGNVVLLLVALFFLLGAISAFFTLPCLTGGFFLAAVSL